MPWLDDYAQRRYGAKIPAAEQAWKILAETVYNEPPLGTAHVNQTRGLHAAHFDRNPSCPSVMLQPIQDRPITQLHYDPAELVQAWKLLLDAAPEAKAADGYRFDLCDVGRQVLANLSANYNQQIVAAFQAHDAKRPQRGER